MDLLAKELSLAKIQYETLQANASALIAGNYKAINITSTTNASQPEDPKEQTGGMMMLQSPVELKRGESPALIGTGPGKPVASWQPRTPMNANNNNKGIPKS